MRTARPSRGRTNLVLSRLETRLLGKDLLSRKFCRSGIPTKFWKEEDDCLVEVILLEVATEQSEARNVTPKERKQAV